jgi:hypothetical protein
MEMSSEIIEESINNQETKESESGLVKYAQHELDLILKQAEKDGDEEDIHMQRVFNEGILKVVKAFSDCGHSGFSASLAIHYLDRLLKFRPLVPLTLEDEEWSKVDIDHKVYQNNRASNVFKSEDKFEGKPYCIDGPNGEVVTLEEYPLCYIGVFTKKENMEEE